MRGEANRKSADVVVATLPLADSFSWLCGRLNASRVDEMVEDVAEARTHATEPPRSSGACVRASAPRLKTHSTSSSTCGSLSACEKRAADVGDPPRRKAVCAERALGAAVPCGAHRLERAQLAEDALQRMPRNARSARRFVKPLFARRGCVPRLSGR